MRQCVIFCAGEMDQPLHSVGEADYIIAADGGLTHTQRLGLTPQCILGDFDSLGYVPQRSQVFPVEKDDTDSMLAARRGLSLGYDRFLFYGAMDGPRLDHTVANFQTLEFLARRGAKGYLVGLTTIATVVREETIFFPEGVEGIVSVFCLGEDARDVTIRGLHYGLEGGTLTAAHPLGVSNHFTGKPASIGVGQGSLLVLYPRSVGLPDRR